MNPICFYHRVDLDGVCSAAIVKHFVPDCELYGIDYGEEFPWEQVLPLERRGGVPDAVDAEKLDRRTVYMVDFSLPVEDMRRLAAVSNLVWIDHHKTAIDACANLNLLGSTGVGAAACELAWRWFSRLHAGATRFNEVSPEAIRLLGAYDSWRKDDPEWESMVLPFQYGARALKGVYDPLSDWWVNVMKSSPTFLEFVTDTGKAILSYQATQNRQACEAGAREIKLKLPGEPKSMVVHDDKNGEDVLLTFGPRFKIADGKVERVPEELLPEFTALACNTTMNTSQFFEGFFDPEKHDVMCCYRQMRDGRWKVSLYSTKPEIDCGAICKAFGGGGHKGAAGFECDRLPWEG